MASGYEVRQEILDFNLAGIKSKVAELSDDQVLMLLDLGDKNGAVIHKAFRVSEGQTEAQADAEIKRLIAEVGPQFRATSWTIVPRRSARGILSDLAGSSNGFDLANDNRAAGERLVAIVAANGTSYANVTPLE